MQVGLRNSPRSAMAFDNAVPPGTPTRWTPPNGVDPDTPPSGCALLFWCSTLGSMTSPMRKPSGQTCRYSSCVALVVAAVADAGPEIVKSGSLIADYDGPGPLIYLAFAAFVAIAPWRYAPVAAVVLSAFFLVGGFADPEFRRRLVTPGETIDFGAGWLQMFAFTAAFALGLAAVWLKPTRHGTPTNETS